MRKKEPTDLDIEVMMREVAGKVEPGENAEMVREIFEEAFGWVEQSRFTKILARVCGNEEKKEWLK